VPSPSLSSPASPYVDLLFPSPVAILIVRAGARATATTVSFFSEVAHHPTSLWVSLSHASFGHELVTESGRFSLSILSRGQRMLAQACGSESGRTTDKVARLHTLESSPGFLFIENAIACTACEVRERIEVGDHTVFIADMLAGERDTRAARAGVLVTTDL
jgi:flavin reductase (DIM6/NTAB) family NADH-FMN oxidoreductase RutF